MRKDMRLSASKIKTYQSCGEKFRMHYLDDEAEPTKADKGYRDLGSAVHDSIEIVLNENPNERDAAMLHHLLKEEYNEWDPDISEKQDKDARKCIQTASRYISQQEGVDIVGVEEWIEFVIDREGITEPAVAICDVIVEREDGTREIWDWKTGRIREETTDEEIRQGVMYMLAHMARYGSLPDSMKFIYLKEEKVHSHTPDEESFEQFLDDARDLVDGVNRDAFVAKPDESKCYFCDYEYYCKASAVGYANVPWELY